LKSVELLNLASDDRGSLQGSAASHDRLATLTISKERIMRNRGSQLALLLVAAGVSGLAGATVQTSPSSEQKSAVVRYSPDDLTSDSGAAHLYSKLARAARFVCDDPGHGVDLEVLGAVSRCEQQAIADAVSTVSSASLTSEYNRHFPYQPLFERGRLSGRLSPSIILVVG
jgi:UrcA family protein